MLVFFDTSAFVKRYVNEPGTGKVLEWCDKAAEIGLSGIALPEIISAFCRLHREARITDAQYRQLKSMLLADIEDAALCDLTPAVLAQAVSNLENNVSLAPFIAHEAPGFGREMWFCKTSAGALTRADDHRRR